MRAPGPTRGSPHQRRGLHRHEDRGVRDDWLGKSNSMKTIATAVCNYAAETGQAIGQLLFDPAGEYANVNVQDRTALSQIGPDYVTIFRYGSDGSEPGIRPLSTNFFRDDNIDVTWSIVTSYLRARKDAVYVRHFFHGDYRA